MIVSYLQHTPSSGSYINNYIWRKFFLESFISLYFLFFMFSVIVSVLFCFSFLLPRAVLCVVNAFFWCTDVLKPTAHCRPITFNQSDSIKRRETQRCPACWENTGVSNCWLIPEWRAGVEATKQGDLKSWSCQLSQTERKLTSPEEKDEYLKLVCHP